MNTLSIPDSNYLSTYDSAYHHVQTACQSHDNLWSLIRICQRHIAGEKPNKPEDLKKKGMSWVSNFNYHKARAKIEKGTAESSAKISTSLALGYCGFRNFKESDKKDKILSFLESPEKRGIVASTIGYALSNTLSKEPRLSGWLNEVEYPSYAFGFCALIYDLHDWMPEPIHPLNIAFKPKTKPQNITSYITFKTIQAEELYSRWVDAHNESTASQENDGVNTTKIVSSGWNLNALEKVLLKAFKGVDKNKRPYESWADVIPAFRSNPTAVIGNTNEINIAKIYYKELNNTISETYIPYNNSWQVNTNDDRPYIDPDSKLNVGEILFNKNHGEYEQDNWITLVRDSAFSETGYIQDYRGIAKYAVEDSFRYNKTRNTTNDKMIFIGSPIFEQSNTTQSDKIKITVSAGYLVIPPNANLVEKNFNFDISPHINMLRFEESEYNRDTQQYDASISGRLTSRPNKGEVEQVTEEVRLADSAKNSVKLKDYSKVFETVVKRIVNVDCKISDPGYKGKKRFFDIIKDQLPWLVETDADVKKLILSIDSYILEPVISNIETITIAIQMAETPFARNRLKRMMLLAKGLPVEEVNTAVPLISDKFANVEDSRIAAFENDLFFLGSEKVAYGTDDHIVHIEAHMVKAQKVIEGVQSGAMKPSDAYAYLTNSILHTQQHIEMLGQDPILNSKAKEYMVGLNKLNQARLQIGQQAQKMAQDAAQNQQPMKPETAEELRQKDIKLQSDIQRKNILAEHRTQQADKKIDLNHDLRLKELELKSQEQNGTNQ